MIAMSSTCVASAIKTKLRLMLSTILLLCLLLRFFFVTPVAAIDLRAIANMNEASQTFYAGMNERIKDLVSAADKVQDHAEDARRFSGDMAVLLQKARRLEALVDRLDEYTSRQEAALSKK